jgi:HD-GYP domain-containing protein (c-di-GMP phosphodiesterase class II)
VAVTFGFERGPAPCGTVVASNGTMAKDTEDGRDAACNVYAGTGIASDGFDPPCRPAQQLLAAGADVTSPAVLLVDATLAEQIGGAPALPAHVVIVATDEAAAAVLGRRATLSLAGVADEAARRTVLHAACQAAVARFAVTQSDAEFQQLSRIGIALMRQHDRKALLRLIVAQSKQLTRSDGGGLLLTRQGEDGRQWLQPVLYAFDSIEGEPTELPTFYPLDETSIIGHAALLKQPIVVADAYDLPHDERFEQGVAFDDRNRYRRRSMLVVPMLDQLARVLGVLLCINRKTDPNARITSSEAADRYVIEYSDREVRLIRMLASQAAVAIETTRLYAQIARTFESFVEASVSAIDLRDPATAGHSLRVAELATGLAEAVERADDGPYRDVRFTPEQMRELRFAALLHDFGKIAVREDVLLKARKLPRALWERIDGRFDNIASAIELESCRAPDHPRGTDVDGVLAARLKELERCRSVVRAANEPSVPDAQTEAELLDIARRTYQRPDGAIAPYLTAEELHYLRIPNGTLDDDERSEMESHVAATQQYLSNVLWTDDLTSVTRYASSHHELLNGSGYPRHLTDDAIPLQTRIITVADVFDALTASDRPYRPSVATDRALEIMEAEAAAGRLDAELVKVLAERQS